MNEELAMEIVRSAVALDSVFGRLDESISKIPDEAERRQFAKDLGDIVGQVNDRFIRPLVKRYPNLEPDSAA